MKILHYTSYFSLPSETFIYDLINLLDRDQDLINYILANKRILADERPFDPTRIELLPLNKFYNTSNRFSRKFFFKFDKLLFKSSINRVVNALNPDIIHGHFGNNGLLIYECIRENNINTPVIISCHGTDTTSLPFKVPAYKKRLLKLNNSKNTIFTVNSNFLKNKLLILGLEEKLIKVVPNSFNPNFSNKRKNNFFKKGDCLKIVNCGRLTSFKGHEYLIKGFAEFQKKYYSNSHLTIIGDGELKNELINLAKNLNVSDKVSFFGFVKHSEVADILKENDLYIQPSIKNEKTLQEEAFGVAILEAIAVGLPVIVTNTGGMPEVIGKECKYAHIIPEKDSGAITNQFIQFIDNCHECSDNVEYAQERVEFFSQEKLAKNIKDLYENVRLKN